MFHVNRYRMLEVMRRERIFRDRINPFQSRKLAPDRRTASDKFPGGPVVFVNSPDRLSGKLFSQPLPLRIDKLRFSVNST